MDNPWNITSIYELQYYNCPSCVYKHILKQEFVNHAYEFHPESIDYLNEIIDESLSDVTCPWNSNNKIVTEPILQPLVEIKTEFNEVDDYYQLDEPLTGNNS